MHFREMSLKLYICRIVLSPVWRHSFMSQMSRNSVSEDLRVIEGHRV